ncbi:MAG: regulatory protein GemA [Defluviitaleaceae bacterium]|nr:regulatory protein GemA [Defluviitaleaceae bacterium]
MDRKALLKAIWGTAKELGMSSEEVHTVLSRETGKDSMRDSTDRQLQRLLDALKLYKGVGEVQKNRLSGKQLHFINGLEKKLGWAGEPERLRGFINKKMSIQVDRPEWLTSQQASKVIEGLKKAIEHAGAKAGSLPEEGEAAREAK